MPNAGSCCVYVGTAALPPALPPVCVTCVSLNLTVLACLCASKRDPGCLQRPRENQPLPSARSLPNTDRFLSLAVQIEV